jgi:hypothetical protein
VARKYLPMLRGLTQLEFAFAEAAQTEFHLPGIGPRLGQKQLAERGEAVRAAASSLFFADDEPQVRIVAPDMSGEILPVRPRRVTVRIRGLGLSYAELLRILAIESLALKPSDTLFLVKRPAYCAAVIWHEEQVRTDVIDIDPDAFDTLAVMLGSAKLRAYDLYNIPLSRLASLLQRSTNDAISEILRRHSEVADRYPEIRSGVTPRTSDASYTANLGLKVIPGQHWLP